MLEWKWKIDRGNMDNILVTRSSMPTLEEYTNEIKDIWSSHWLTNNGVKNQELRAKLQEFLKVNNLETIVNGHMALEIALQALDLPSGGEIITTPFTFVSTTHSIVRCGFKPVFCDINYDDYTIDASKIEGLITEKTVAILPVHVYGNICNIEEIDRIAKKHNLKVLYDAAHTFGITVNGKGVGSFGDMSIFSFHATKVYNTIEGGAICFNDEKYKVTIEEVRDFGIHDEESIPFIGPNGKMNEFCAAMGICNLRHVEGEIEKRRAVVERYKKHLSKMKGVKLCEIAEGVKTNYAYFPVVFTEECKKTRNQVFDELKANGIGSRKYFYPLINAIEAYKDSYDKNDTPLALDISNRVLTLPLFADLPLEEVDRICKIITE